MSADEPIPRQFPRIPAENTVLIQPLGPADQEALTKTRQIGLGGVLVSSVDSLGVDSYLRLIINLEHDDVEATGRVVWEKATEEGTFDIGVAFVSIDAAHRDRILALMPPLGEEPT
jgi:hypothetical protein